MKILQICSASSIGGGERHLADLSNSLAQRGHEVFAALRPESPLVTMLTEINAERIFAAPMRNAAGLISASRIAGFAGRNEIDVIHAHLARDYPIAAFVSRLSGIPFVLTRHVLFPMKRLQKFVLHRVSAVIAPSTAVRDFLVREGVLPESRISLVHNGIDVDRFLPTTSRQHDAFTVGTIGHLGKVKGHDLFIRAAAIAARKATEMRFVVVGEDKSRGRSRLKLETLIRELQMEGRIDLLGWTDNIRDQLAEMDIFVSAARTEPFGLAICEAMAAGLPVIATASEGASEIIVDGESGRLVPLEDPDALAGAMLEVAGDDVKRTQLAAGGRRRVIGHFTLGQMVEKTEDIYRRVTEAPNRTE